MLKVRPFLMMCCITGAIMLSCIPAYANAVVDVFNTARRQIMKNTELQAQIDIIQQGSPGIADYVGLEIDPITGKRKLTDDTPYKCSNNVNFDSNYGCRDWALDGTNLLTTRDQIVKINKILGDTKPLDSHDRDHRSLAVQYINCLEGTTNPGTKRASFRVAACKELMGWDYNPIMLEGMANSGLLEYFYSPEMEYVVVMKDGKKTAISRPKRTTGYPTPSRDIYTRPDHTIDKFIRTKVNHNVCEITRAAAARRVVEKQGPTAKRLALAQGYAIAVNAQRAGEIFEKRAVPYLHQLAAIGSKYNPKTIRQDIHLLLAADVGMIYVLRHINSVQGLITEITALKNGIDGIKTYDGVTHLIGEIKSQEELCGP